MYIIITGVNPGAMIGDTSPHFLRGGMPCTNIPQIFKEWRMFILIIVQCFFINLAQTDNTNTAICRDRGTGGLRELQPPHFWPKNRNKICIK